MKRLTSVLLAAVIVTAMSISVFAAGVTGAGAQDIALKNAKLTKSQVKHLRTEYDAEDGIYEVDFRSKKNGAKYSYEIGAHNGKIYERSIDYRYKINYSKKKVGKTAARKAASKKSGVSLSTVKRGTCSYDYDDGEGLYDVEFSSGNYKYDIEVQAATGKVTEYNWEYRGR